MPTTNSLQRRYETANVCKECRQSGVYCETGKACDRIKKPLRPYGGIRFTSDGFDCALPIAIDSHSHCAYGCLYCFADNLIEHRKTGTGERDIGQTSLKEIERIFAEDAGSTARENILHALRYKNKKNGYRAPIQLGAICDPMDNIERQQGWLLELIKLAIRYDQPIRMSTKGNLFLVDEYLDAVSERPELFWVAFSIITCDDDKISRIDARAPNATERIKCMKRLTSRGIKTSLRMRPIMPGISDYTPKYPQAYKTLIQMCAEAGANAISYETAFTPGMMTKDLKKRWTAIEQILNIPMIDIYRRFGKREPCTRPSYQWTENIMHAIKEVAVDCGLTVGVSDPVWKQLTDSGCCCGIKPDDPVFGNWEIENATNALMKAKATGKEIFFKDICPPWAQYKGSANNLVAFGAGPYQKALRQNETWQDLLRSNWNDLKSVRGPLLYFQGALKPVRKDDNGDIVYKYVGLKRQNKKYVPYWTLLTDNEVKT